MEDKRLSGYDIYGIILGVVVIALIVGLFGYQLGTENGREYFLDGMELKYCDSTGNFCYIDKTNVVGGEYEIPCDEFSRCFVVDR